MSNSGIISQKNSELSTIFIRQEVFITLHTHTPSLATSKKNVIIEKH